MSRESRQCLRELSAALLALLSTFVINEHLSYTLHALVYPCTWPVNEEADGSKRNSTVHALIFADTHLLSLSSNKFDRLRRGWQALKSFQAAVRSTKPDIILMLGDLFDEGKKVDAAGWEEYVSRWKSFERVVEGSPAQLHVIPGNHDVGDYACKGAAQRRRCISTSLWEHHSSRFARQYGSPNRHFTFRGVQFIMLDSLALGDPHQNSTAFRAADSFVNSTARRVPAEGGRRRGSPPWEKPAVLPLLPDPPPVPLRRSPAPQHHASPSSHSQDVGAAEHLVGASAALEEHAASTAAEEAPDDPAPHPFRHKLLWNWGPKIAKRSGKLWAAKDGTLAEHQGASVVLTHLPLYRPDDSRCLQEDWPRCAPWHGADTCLSKERSARVATTRSYLQRERYAEGVDVLPDRYSESLLERLQPAAVLSAHTHRRCHTLHRTTEGLTVPEVTLSTLSWRYRDDPSYALASISSSGEVRVEHCAALRESIVIGVYVVALTLCGGLLLVWLRRLWSLLLARLSSTRGVLQQHHRDKEL